MQWPPMQSSPRVQLASLTHDVAAKFVQRPTDPSRVTR